MNKKVTISRPWGKDVIVCSKIEKHPNGTSSLWVTNFSCIEVCTNCIKSIEDCTEETTKSELETTLEKMQPCKISQALLQILFGTIDK